MQNDVQLDLTALTRSYEQTISTLATRAAMAEAQNTALRNKCATLEAELASRGAQDGDVQDAG